MKNFFAKSAALLAIVFGMASCSKDDNNNVSNSETNFNTYVIGKKFTVAAAKNGVDSTDKFTGYVFNFTKATAVSGNATASNDLLNFNGTWSVSSDFSLFTINYASAPADFNFINDTWKITGLSDTYVNLTSASNSGKTLDLFAIKR